MKSDEKWMLEAIRLGEMGKGSAPPNPWVGSILVKNDQLIGKGYHTRPGEDHAEVVAIKEANELTEGATLYVTLEPCSHHGKTPPCVDAIIQAKIKKVVIALEDPDEKVKGKGIIALKKAGIQVLTGTLKHLAFQSLEPYLFQRENKKPFCWLKLASSLDGKIAASDGSSKWISTEEALIDVHELRASSQAILIGSGTAKIDRPKLTIRKGSIVRDFPPFRVVLDAYGETSEESPICDTKEAPTIIYTTSAAPPKKTEAWKKKGVDVIFVSADLSGNGVNFEEVLQNLYTKGVIQVLVEGGATVHSRLLEKKNFQRLTVYFGPKLIGKNGISFFQNEKIRSMEQALLLHLLHVKKLGDTIRLDYRLA